MILSVLFQLKLIILAISHVTTITSFTIQQLLSSFQTRNIQQKKKWSQITTKTTTKKTFDVVLINNQYQMVERRLCCHTKNHVHYHYDPHNNHLGIRSFGMRMMIPQTTTMMSTTTGMMSQNANDHDDRLMNHDNEYDNDDNNQYNNEEEVEEEESIQYEPDESKEIQELIQFLMEEECEGITDTCIGYSTLPTTKGRRGVYVKQSYEPGEYIIAVPLLTALDITYTTEELTDLDKAIVFLQKYHYNNNNCTSSSSNNSKWQPYLNTLPTILSNFDPTPDFWNVSDIEELQIPQLIHDTYERQQKIQIYASKYQVNEKELQFITWLLRSRIFTTIKKIPFSSQLLDQDSNMKHNTTTAGAAVGVVDNTATSIDSSDIDVSSSDTDLFLQRSVLIPYMDMLNHANATESNAMIQVIEGNNDNESMYCVQATKYIPSGHEICITYGTGYETSLDLFMSYGFCDTSAIITPTTTQTLNNKNNNSFENMIKTNANDWNIPFDEYCTNWTTTIDEDKQLLQSILLGETETTMTDSNSNNNNNNDHNNRRKAIELRLYLKQLQQQQSL